jgi:Ala-tRNA(Pro) deacylase
VSGSPIAESSAQDGDLYSRLIADLDAAGAEYRIIDHAPEGRTDRVSVMRGHPTAHAAKCLIVMVKTGRKERRYVLAVVPGDARLDITAVQRLYDGSYAALAAADKAEALAGCQMGTVLPVSYHSQLELIVDPALLNHPVVYFNAARLDRSVGLRTTDYVRVAQPRFESISSAD